MAFDWTTFWFVVIIGFLVVAFVLVLMWYVSLSKKRKKLPSHINLYFDENFRKIMDEWDFNTYLERHSNPVLYSMDRKLDKILKTMNKN